MAALSLNVVDNIPDRLFDFDVEAEPTGSDNFKKGRSEPVRTLEEALAYLTAKRKVCQPLSTFPFVTKNGVTKKCRAMVSRSPYTKFATVVVLTFDGRNGGTIKVTSTTDATGETVIFEPILDLATIPFRATIHQIQVGVGDDSDLGDEEIIIELTHSTGASTNLTMSGGFYIPHGMSQIVLP